MLFSFVLPAYKAKYLASSIESILSQTYKEFELIIVNDASPENLDCIVNKFNDSRIKYYKNSKNIGGKDLVKQWNHCISYAIGDFIILASDDDLYTSNFLSTFEPLINLYPEVNLFRGRSLSIDGENNICETDNYFKEYINPNEFRYLWFKGIKGGIANYIFKRKELQSIGGFVNFPLAWGSDDATVLLMANKGIVTSNDYLFSFRYSGINISCQRNNEFLIQKLKARIELCYWKKQFLKIDSNSRLDDYYQEKILVMHEAYNFSTPYNLVMSMKFQAFLKSINIILSFNLLTKKQKYKILIDKIRLIIIAPFAHTLTQLKSLLFKSIGIK